MVAQLEEALHEISRSDSVRVIVLRSLVNKCFSAGADLKERAVMPQEEVARFVDRLRDTFGMMESLPVPTIAALDGIALGGGLELALCCDLRYAGPDGRMGLPESKLAILPAAGGSQRMPRLIGASRAKEMIFTGNILNSEEAFRYGIVNAAVSGRTAFEHGMDIASKICKNGPLAVKYAKEAVNKGLSADVRTGLAIEKLCYAQLIPTEDRREGLTAFKEGRDPVYRGK